MDKRKYIQDAIDKLFAIWLRSATDFGALIFLFLSFLDLVVFREYFELFLAYRFAIALFLFLISVLAGKTTNRMILRALGLAAVAASAVTIEALILQTGGHHSSYATGMILLAVIALSFLPAEFPFHATTAALIYGIYLLPIIMTEHIDDMLAFFTTNFFMCSIILAVLVFRYLSMQNLRKQLGTEYELHRLSAEREAILDNIASSVFLLKNRRVIWANRKAEELFGYSFEEIDGKDTSIFYPERESFEQLGREAYPLLAQGKTYSRERQMKKKGGELIWCSIIGQAINALDLEQGAIWLLDDITERKHREKYFEKASDHLEEMVATRTEDLEKTIAQLEAEASERQRAEAALERSRKLLHDVFEGIQDGIAVLDTEQNIIMANSAAKRFFGCSDPIGSKMEEKTTQVENIAYKPDELDSGSLEKFTFPFYGEQGEIKGVIQYLRDITERQRAEETLRLHSEIMKNVAEGIYLIRLQDGIIVFTNPRFEKMFGYGPGEMIGKHISIVNAPTDKSPVETADKIMESICKTGEWHGEVYNIRKDGSTFWCNANVSTFNHPTHGEVVLSIHTDITERILADEAVKESEKRFKKLLDGAPIAISIVNMDGTVEYINRKHPEIMGYDLQDIPTLEHWWSQAYPDETDRTGIKAAWNELSQRVFKGEKISAVNRKIVCKNGAIKEMELSFRAAADKIVVTFGDITERKQTEKKLQEKESKMRAMLESFDGLIYICSPDYRVEFMNENLVRRTGRNAVGEQCYTVLNDLDSICPWCVNERVLRGETIRYEVQSPKDGRWYHVVNTPIQHADGSISKQAMILDVTERKKGDIALKESEERYRRLVASVTDYIYTINVEDSRPVATEHGEGCVAVTGYTPEEYEVDPDLWFNMVYDADLDSITEQVKKIMQGEKTGPLEHRIVHRNGSIRWVRNIMSPLFDKNQQLISFDGLVSDITEKKMLEEQLEKARAQEARNLKIFSRLLIEAQEKERRAIARELHDEIGQSLTGLKLSFENATYLLPSDQLDKMKAIELSLGEMLDVVRNMSLNLRPAMLDDFGLLSTLNWHFERYKSQTGISVNFRQTGADKRFDQQKEITLYRITQEALTNVARHAEVNSVMVELIIEQDRVTLRIRDEGLGFDTWNMVHAGSGLSIMRERSILLNGSFSLSSAPGNGTEVTVTIPIHDREEG